MNHKSTNEARLLLSSILPAEDFEDVTDIPISPSLFDVIRRASRSLPKSRGDSHLTVDQLFLGLLEDSQIKDLLKDAGISDVARVRTLLMPLSYPIAITPRHLHEKSIDSDDQGIQLHSQSEKRDNSERRRIHEMRRWMDEIQILKRRQNMLSQWGETFGLADFKFESVQELDAAIAKLEGDVNDSLEQSSWAMPMKSSAPSRWNEKERLIGLAERLCERVVGQNQAVETVAEVVLRSRAGSDGDSKTELAKALAEQLFGNENFLIRIDLSEYKEQRSLRRLIGGPLVDDEDGQLTAAVRRKPYSVVLFDRVEKAHDSVLKSLLHMLGLGRLADGQNWDVDFTNTVIIMTSNLTRTEKDSPLQIAREILIDEVCLLIYLK
ncbi:chaperone protein ClpB1-like [Zingiber officinale]|uniref:chaperone protein ClpB1-like n=1 Tax=Zingiber officinale TaxID=94328 RepID=UPI001C4B0FC6|nr:chaperone protein ClpB1-like [Zingiber officinale]